MSTQTMDYDAARVLPSIDTYTIWTVLLAGAMSTVAFDYFGQSLSPMLGFSGLAPVPLANQVISVIFGSGHRPSAELLHYFAGMIAYPVGWVFIFQPLARKFTPSIPTWIVATVYGVVLWVFALFIMASLIAGNPPFLNFTGITWVALVGHVLFAWVTAAMVGWRENKRPS
ncbi:MAG: hypothetical protein AAF414_10490 [Pseudomonadota bacterium]